MKKMTISRFWMLSLTIHLQFIFSNLYSIDETTPDIEKWDTFIEKLYQQSEGKASKPFSAVEILARDYLWQINSQSPVLDIGCEIGKNAICLIEAGHEVVLVDISPKAIFYTQENLKKLILDDGIVATYNGKILVLCNQFEEHRDPQSVINSSFSFQVVSILDEDTDTDKIIQEVLALQNSLIIDNQSTTELSSPFKENGFLTIRMNPENIRNTLSNGGRIITTQSQDQLVGYLILCQFGFQWLRNAERVDVNFQKDLNELEHYLIDSHVEEIEQIAVAHSFAKQGIGRHMIELAKQLSPQGLLTCILCKPFTNEASLSFFSKQDFIQVATVHLLGKPPKHLPHEIVIEVWMP